MLRQPGAGCTVGSAFVRGLEAKKPIDEMVKDVGDLVQTLADALHD